MTLHFMLGAAMSAAVLCGCSQTVIGAPKPAGAATPSNTSTGEFADVAGDWVGQYDCAQGATGLTLDIEASGRTEFHFYPLPANAAAASGTFEMQAAVSDSGLLEFDGIRWMDQPTGYVMVDLVAAEQTETVMRGDVVGAGCTTFEVTRDRT